MFDRIKCRYLTESICRKLDLTVYLTFNWFSEDSTATELSKLIQKNFGCVKKCTKLFSAEDFWI